MLWTGIITAPGAPSRVSEPDPPAGAASGKAERLTTEFLCLHSLLTRTLTDLRVEGGAVTGPGWPGEPMSTQRSEPSCRAS